VITTYPTLQFRADPDAGFVTCTLTLDGEKIAEFGRIAIAVANDKKTWLSWKKMMSDHLGRFMKTAIPGSIVAGMFERKVSEDN
jgi:hypothetical protein